MSLSTLLSEPLWAFAALACGGLFALWLGTRRVVTRLEARLAQSDLEESSRIDLEEAHERSTATRAVIGLLAWLLPACVVTWSLVSGTPLQRHLMDWAQLLVRWTHVIAGIMWIGASFYFIFLENHLERSRGVREELAGHLWAVHGGGFYHVEKYKGAPARLPEKLHWFKYEAYFTWISGISLLVLVYYTDARMFLIDPNVAAVEAPVALAVALGSLVLGWSVYDLLCRSPLVERPRVFAFVGFALLCAMVFALTHLLSGRAAYLHVGAVIGTIMAGNVFFVIIPAQRALVRAARTGRQLDLQPGNRAGLRSLHNNYLTLPVVFTMISPHFPGTFAHPQRALILIVLILASAGIKHYWNLIERGARRPWLLVASLLALISVSLAVAPTFEKPIASSANVPYASAAAIIRDRCASCHSSHPTDDVFTTAPNGVMYDTPGQIQGYAEQIMARAITTESMPLANKTSMTAEERRILQQWILQGARTDR